MLSAGFRFLRTAGQVCPEDFLFSFPAVCDTAQKSKTMNNENKEPIAEFDLSLIANFFSGLDRQGPGGDDQTLRALAFIPRTGPDLRIADIGCGSGRQTELLAKHLDGTVTAVDLLPEMIAGLDARMRKAGLEKRVTGTICSMDSLPFADNSLDILWAEGSIYNIGFGRGLTAWRRFLKRGGIIAVTECSWRTKDHPTTAFVEENFPEIDTPSGKLRVLEEAGYEPLAHFVLPESCWTTNYYTPMAARIPLFLEEQHHSPSAVRFTEMLRQEIAHYRKYGAYYGYVFYIGRKTEE